jgi:hypothetical protein
MVMCCVNNPCSFLDFSAEIFEKEIKFTRHPKKKINITNMKSILQSENVVLFYFIFGEKVLYEFK